MNAHLQIFIVSNLRDISSRYIFGVDFVCMPNRLTGWLILVDVVPKWIEESQIWDDYCDVSRKISSCRCKAELHIWLKLLVQMKINKYAKLSNFLVKMMLCALLMRLPCKIWIEEVHSLLSIIARFVGLKIHLTTPICRFTTYLNLVLNFSYTKRRSEDEKRRRYTYAREWLLCYV